jgi:cytidylate kinase
MLLIISGISGSGKSTLGRVVANDLGWQYLDLMS